MTQQTRIKVDQVVFRKDLYPRFNHDAATIQRYAESIEFLPAIEVNQNYELIDGFHRWTAHKKAGVVDIEAKITKTASDGELLGLAIERNATHGLQLSMEDKKSMARKLYASKAYDKKALKVLLKVSTSSLAHWLSDLDKAEREERKKLILDMWLGCYTAEEIAESISYSVQPVKDAIDELSDFSASLQKNPKVTFSDFDEDDGLRPIYNVWTFSKKTNEVSHFGNSEQRIVDNLLYLYTDPFDIVVDPFAGGGSTIDVCKKRMRRYWVSDRKPIVERENQIRKLDIAQELPALNKRWSDVTLTYLDPPYWRQAQNKYSKDKEDLANMPLEEFTAALSGVVKRISEKQSKGVIALIIQPTQWNAEERQFADHVTDLIKAVGNKRLTLENRVSCPYSTEQCNPQMVDWAKKNKKLLVLSRELIIWRVNQ